MNYIIAFFAVVMFYGVIFGLLYATEWSERRSSAKSWRRIVAEVNEEYPPGKPETLFGDWAAKKAEVIDE